MTPFEFVLSFISIILGLALTQVLAGLGKAVQSRKKIHIGWLAPLLGLVVGLDLTSFWITAWFSRAWIPATAFSIMCGFMLTSIYYFVARITFPDNPAEWPNYDLYYFEHRRLVAGGIILCNLIALGFQLALGLTVADWFSKIAIGLQFLLQALVIVARSRVFSLIVLILLALLYPSISIALMLLRP